MARDLIESARAFVARYGLRLCEALGSGIHGSVHLVQDNFNRGATALKVHHSQEYYDRELAVYLRLREAKVSEVLGFAVPQFIRADDELLGIEMTVVERPYLLDFAGAFLDTVPEFPEEVWTEWEADNREKFGHRWPEVQEVLAALEDYEIHLLDINPGNLAFAE